MLTITSVMLREVLKKALNKSGMTKKEAAEYMDCDKQNLYNFLSGRVSSPYEDVWTKIEGFCEENGFTQHAITRMIGKTQKRQKVVKPTIKFAVDLCKGYIQRGDITQTQFVKETGMPHGSISSFLSQEGRVRTKNVERMFEWLLKTKGLSEEKIEQMAKGETFDEKEQLQSMGITGGKDAVLSSGRAGKHYVCVNMNDDDFIDVLSSLGSNQALPQERRRELIRMLFKQDFPSA